MKECVQREFYDVRRTALLHTQQETDRLAEGRRRWLIYGSGVTDYDLYFRDLVHKPGLAEYVRGIQERPFHAMDAFAEGQFLRDLSGIPHGISGGISLTLADLRKPEVKRFDAMHNLSLVAGDAFRGSTWEKVRHVMQEQAIPSFRLITHIPHCGMFIADGPTVRDTGVAVSLDLQFILLNRYWTLLSPDGGTILACCEFDHGKATEAIGRMNRWSSLMRQQGIDTETSFRAIRITRHTDSPKFLPRLPI